MERRILSEQLLLIFREYDAGDTVVIDRFNFLSNYTLQLDSADLVRVVTQRPAGLLPITTTRVHPSDPNGPLVRTGPGRVMDGYYTVIERPPRPPATQTAPDQQPEDEAEGWQVSRVKLVLKELFPPNGLPPADMSVKTVHARVNELFEGRGERPTSRDTVARAMGRRRA
jgi:hypothetical protein